jgi:hypothetical protein
MLIGASVASSICKKMIKGDVYANKPDVLMPRMLKVLIST